MDAANDLALLKAEGRFAALPVVASRAVRLWSTVATVGFPNVGLQGFAPKLARVIWNSTQRRKDAKAREEHVEGQFQHQRPSQ